jgi:hypothetical protein
MGLTNEGDFLMLTKYLISKRAIINLRNNDHRSFGYSIIFAFIPNDWRIYARNPQNDYKFNKIGLDKLKYPVLIDELPAIE